MKTKKVLSVVLVLLLIFAGCGKSDQFSKVPKKENELVSQEELVLSDESSSEDVVVAVSLEEPSKEKSSSKEVSQNDSNEEASYQTSLTYVDLNMELFGPWLREEEDGVTTYVSEEDPKKKIQVSMQEAEYQDIYMDAETLFNHITDIQEDILGEGYILSEEKNDFIGNRPARTFLFEKESQETKLYGKVAFILDPDNIYVIHFIQEDEFDEEYQQLADQILESIQMSSKINE